MSYTEAYLNARNMAEMIRSGQYDSYRNAAESKRQSAGIVKRPKRRKKKETSESEGGAGGFFGAFSGAFNTGMQVGETGTVEADDPAGSIEAEERAFPVLLARTMNMAAPKVNTPENRAQTGQTTPDDVEAQRQARIRQDFHNHLEEGGTVSDFDFVKYQYGDDTIRNKPVSDKLLEDMSFLKDMGIQMVVYSGGQDAKGHGDRRTGSTRHDGGNAADAYFVDMKTGEVLDWSDPKNRTKFQEIFYRGYQNGVKGWGAHSEYMGTKNVHLGYGAPAVWGKGGKGLPADWLWEAWNRAQSGDIPRQFAQDARTTSTLMASGNSESRAPASLIQTESSGRWDASNNEAGAGGKGHFGRVQFSRARLQEAKDAGAIPASMTPEQFMADKEAQIAAENWHFADIEEFIYEQGLDKYVGKKIKGIPITIQGMIAVAHLGGQTGLKRFITSNGAYDRADAYGTSLSDYLKKHMA